MTHDSNRAFRDYATRISFNLSLSRNQLGHLAGVVSEIEAYEANSTIGWERRMDVREAACEASGGRPNMFIVGRGSLARMGLIERDPRQIEDDRRKESEGPHRKSRYDGPVYRLTPAGAHVVALCRLAGLIAPAAANSNRKRKRRKSA